MKKALKSPIVLALFGALLLSLPTLAQASESESFPPVRSRAERDALTPQQIVDSFIEGNERFVSGRRRGRDLLLEQRTTSSGQHPSAIVLSCIDSRAPVEFVFDKGIGEIFSARIAGNVVNSDIAGSMEFACLAAGAKVIVVVGHSNCGAIKGAIDKVELGNLTELLARVEPAIEMAEKAKLGERSSSNSELVNAVTRCNVETTIAELRRLSPLLADKEAKGELKIIGTVYDVATGRAEFLPESE